MGQIVGGERLGVKACTLTLECLAGWLGVKISVSCMVECWRVGQAHERWRGLVIFPKWGNWPACVSRRRWLDGSERGSKLSVKRKGLRRREKDERPRQRRRHCVMLGPAGPDGERETTETAV